MAQKQQLTTQPNPDSKLADGVSPGFQRQVMADAQLSRRDFIRASINGTSSGGSFTTDPISRQGLQAFRSDAITCCVEMAAISRTSSSPVLIQLLQHQANSVKMSFQGQTTGNGHDTVLACVTPNQGNMYAPNPMTSGAQLSLANLLNNPLTFGLTELNGTPISDASAFYFSLVFFERLPPA